MKFGVMQLCILSMLCGSAMSICPEGSVKRIMKLLSAAVLTVSIVSPLKSISPDIFSDYNGSMSTKEEMLVQSSEELTGTITAAVIQQQTEEYIKNKADELQIADFDIDVELCEVSGGIWTPYSASISGITIIEQEGILKEMISDQLGIPDERQYWHDEG